MARLLDDAHCHERRATMPPGRRAKRAKIEPHLISARRRAATNTNAPDDKMRHDVISPDASQRRFSFQNIRSPDSFASAHAPRLSLLMSTRRRKRRVLSGLALAGTAFRRITLALI